jgi:integrase
MLTDTRVKNLKAKNKTLIELDGQGLKLYVGVGGTKTWVHRYTINKQQKTTTLGHYPAMSLAEARQARDKNKILMRQGIDPKQHLQIQINTSITFEKLFYEWHELNQKNWSNKYFNDVEQRARHHLLPYIGSMPINTIEPHTMLSLLKKIDNTGKSDTMKKIRGISSRVFRYGFGMNIVHRDPTYNLPRDVFRKVQTKHYAHFTNPKDIGNMMRAIDNYKWSYAVGAALKLSPHLFLRPFELAGMPWKEVEFDNKLIRINKNRTKRNRDLIVPMSSQVLNIMKDLYLIDVGSEFVFPSPRSAKRHITPDSIRIAIRSLGFTKKDLTTHGMRHTASTQLNELGFNRDAIERQLSHFASTTNKVRATYNHAEYLNERKLMMQAWSDYLYKLKNTKKITLL